MAMLLRRRSVLSSCVKFLHDALLHQSYEGLSPLSWPPRSLRGNRNLSSCSRITELAAHFLHPKPFRTTRPIWRPECGRWLRSAYSGQSTHNGQEELKGPEVKKGVGSRKLVLYRAKWIRPIRLLVRLKLIQFGGVMALVIPLAEYTQQGSLSLGTTLAVGGVVGGAGAASTALWYYSRRLIGEMTLLLPDLRIMQISVLDFWGNREDLQYDVSDVLPPLKGMTKEELERAAQQIVIPLDVGLPLLIFTSKIDTTAVESRSSNPKWVRSTDKKYQSMYIPCAGHVTSSDNVILSFFSTRFQKDRKFGDFL